MAVSRTDLHQAWLRHLYGDNRLGPPILVVRPAGKVSGGFGRGAQGDMNIVELPGWRLRGVPDRMALRIGRASSRAHLQVVNTFEEARPAGYCDRCAAPIESGAVMHGSGVFCSVECSLEGPRTPA